MQKTWVDAREAVRISQNWDEFIIECSLREVWWRPPVFVIDDIAERFRYLTGSLDSYRGYWND